MVQRNRVTLLTPEHVAGELPARRGRPREAMLNVDPVGGAISTAHRPKVWRSEYLADASPEDSASTRQAQRISGSRSAGSPCQEASQAIDICSDL